MKKKQKMLCWEVRKLTLPDDVNEFMKLNPNNFVLFNISQSNFEWVINKPKIESG